MTRGSSSPASARRQPNSPVDFHTGFHFLRRDPIRFVGRLLGQPFLLGRCLRERFGLRDASRVGLLLSELLERTRGLLTFLLRFRFGGGRRLRLPLGLLFGTSRFLRRFLSGGFPRCRLFGQACVEINQ